MCISRESPLYPEGIAPELIDPVVAADGNTYEKEFIEIHFKTSTKSPLTNIPFAHLLLVTNVNLHETIRNWLTMAQKKKHTHQSRSAKRNPPLRIEI